MSFKKDRDPKTRLMRFLMGFVVFITASAIVIYLLANGLFTITLGG